MFFKLPVNTNVLLKHFRKLHIPNIYKLSFLRTYFTLNLFGFYNNSKITENKTTRYWLIETLPELLDEADRLYYDEYYLEVYETLNRLKFQNNVEIQWRICRVLYKMSFIEESNNLVKENMIQEAYDLIKNTLELDDKHPEVHKWMAIILDYKASLAGSYARIQTGPQIYNHIKKSLELHDNDPTTLYMLGIWCYEISKLSWIKKLIAKYIFHLPEKTNIEQAYNYFLKAEQAKPRFFVGNIYMLGICSYELGMFFRARYYLKIAGDLPGSTELERSYSETAKKLAEKLKKYEVAIHTLCE